MNDISSKIYNLMLENNIKEEQIVSYLKNVIDLLNLEMKEPVETVWEFVLSSWNFTIRNWKVNPRRLKIPVYRKLLSK